MSFNEYLIKNLNEMEFDFESWLKKTQQDLRPISIEDAESLLDTQDGVSEFIYSTYKGSEKTGPAILMDLINGEEV